MKTCIKCGNTLPEKAFYKNRNGRLNKCKFCCREDDKKYKQQNKEKRANQKRIWDEKNKKHVKEYMQEYRKLNAIQIKAAHIEWKRKNRERLRIIKNAANAQRRAAKHSALVGWADKRKIKEIYRAAREITESTGIQFHVDHIIPLQGKNVCGLHWEYNLQVLPWYENIRKHNKLIEDIV